MSTPIERQKQQLVEYLIDQVVNGISGRDGDDIVDASPSRVLFAGVLQPARRTDSPNPGANPADTVPPADTALGLDFRIAALPGTPLTLKIIARWSHYYPVFPTYAQAVFANSGLLRPPVEGPRPGSATTQKDSAQPSGVETPSSQITGDPSPDTPPDEADQEPEPPSDRAAGRVVLPRAFRRYDVTLDPLVVALRAEVLEPRLFGAAEVAAAISKTRADIQSDPRLWRHLAEPTNASRDLGDASNLANPDSYSKALSEAGRAPASPPPWALALQVDTTQDPARPDTLRVRVLLSNTTTATIDPETDRLLEERAIFDARLTVEVLGGEVVPFDFLLAPKDYRSKPQMPARGINCTAKANADLPNQLATETLPLFKQPYYRTKEGLEIAFATLDLEDPTADLEKIAREMDSYLEAWDKVLAEQLPAAWRQPEIEACRRDREEFRRETETYRLGIETLRRDTKLREAFRLMNRAFTKLGQSSGGRLRAWRLFQIGFIVSQLPALAVRELAASASDVYANTLREMLNEVAVLWFPTGGGKTESYLGLIAVALLYDRLRGKTSGVCAWMRFPLRMLSLQQLERLSKVIAMLNELRTECPQIASGDPFAVGYYVGDSVTPNSISADRMRELETDKASREALRQIRKCPFCDSAVEIKPLRATWRVAHVCTNAQCFSNKSDTLGIYKGSLPLCVTDNEIYRYLPSVLVGTVDKLAIVARSRYFAHIVRGARQRCPTHGYTSYDECVERGNWGADCDAKKRKLIATPPVRDPGPSLLIQDELHLLRAELGVFNGHYEGLLKYLGERAHMRPKVLAATATIEAYDVHTFHVYLARSRRYPQSAWEAGESFYATSKPLRLRRFYLGILNHTRGIEDSAIRAVSLYIRAIRRLKGDTRKAAQIMGKPEATDPEVLAILRLYDLSLCYVNRKATGGSLSDKMTFVERFLDRESLGTIKNRILTGDQPTEYIGDTLDLIEREKNETSEPRLDVVIATNLISHGVDLERINMMTVCGMPSHYAEYVQSTSRAARSHPGIVFVCFKSRDPREHSQFEFFTQMHEHMERLIEAVAVNRFASFAPRKTVPGLLAGLLLCEYSPRLFGTEINKTLDHVPTLQIALGLKPGNASTTAGCVNPDELHEAIRRIIGVDKIYPPASAAQVENVRRRLAEAFEDQMGAIGRTFEAKLADAIKPITSFRDVDEGIDFGSKDSSMIVGRLRAK
jgi:hypothetical protein